MLSGQIVLGVGDKFGFASRRTEMIIPSIMTRMMLGFIRLYSHAAYGVCDMIWRAAMAVVMASKAIRGGRSHSHYSFINLLEIHFLIGITKIAIYQP